MAKVLSKNMREQKLRFSYYRVNSRQSKDKDIDILQNTELSHDAGQEKFYSIVGKLEQNSLLKESILRGDR